MVYAVLIAKDDTQVSSLKAVLFLTGILLVLGLIICKGHFVIPKVKGLNVKEAIQSIEEEQFTSAGDGMWYSQNWIRIGMNFYPKNAVLKIRGSDNR